MLDYAITFLIIALVAAVFGFGGIAAGAVDIARVLFAVFILLFIVSLVVPRINGNHNYWNKPTIGEKIDNTIQNLKN